MTTGAARFQNKLMRENDGLMRCCCGGTPPPCDWCDLDIGVPDPLPVHFEGPWDDISSGCTNCASVMPYGNFDLPLLFTGCAWSLRIPLEYPPCEYLDTGQDWWVDIGVRIWDYAGDGSQVSVQPWVRVGHDQMSPRQPYIFADNWNLLLPTTEQGPIDCTETRVFTQPFGHAWGGGFISPCTLAFQTANDFTVNP